MKAYNNIRLISDNDWADPVDIRNDGRKSSVGRLKKGTFAWWKNRPSYSERGYCKSNNKASVRRYLKRKDRMIEIEFDRMAEDYGF